MFFHLFWERENDAIVQVVRYIIIFYHREFSDSHPAVYVLKTFLRHQKKKERRKNTAKCDVIYFHFTSNETCFNHSSSAKINQSTFSPLISSHSFFFPTSLSHSHTAIIINYGFLMLSILSVHTIAIQCVRIHVMLK